MPQRRLAVALALLFAFALVTGALGLVPPGPAAALSPGHWAGYLPLALSGPRAPTATPSPTATCTPSPSPSVCPDSQQMLQNTGFEDGLAPWQVAQGSPVLATDPYTEANHTLQLGGADNAVDGVVQQVTVPGWAQAGELYFYYLASSEDSMTWPADYLEVIIRDETSGLTLLWTTLDNTEPGWEWWLAAPEIPAEKIVAARGHSLSVSITSRTDGQRPTTWYIDDVELYFMCR